jgi:hypothetical protein
VTFWGEISSSTDEDSEARGDSEEHTVFAVTGDRDLDGILDVWEGQGIRLERRGVPATLYDLANSIGDYPELVSTGSQMNHKDIFVEIDYMKNHKPSDDALQDVIRAFASAPVSNPDGLPGINLHIFVDEQISNSSWKDNHQYSIKSSDVLGIAFTTPLARTDPISLEPPRREQTIGPSRSRFSSSMRFSPTSRITSRAPVVLPTSPVPIYLLPWVEHVPARIRVFIVKGPEPSREIRSCTSWDTHSD